MDPLQLIFSSVSTEFDGMVSDITTVIIAFVSIGLIMCGYRYILKAINRGSGGSSDGTSYDSVKDTPSDMYNILYGHMGEQRPYFRKSKRYYADDM